METAMKASAIAVLAALTGSVLANPVIVADSVDGYSDVQGANGWSYGWYNAEDITINGSLVSADTADFRQFDFYSPMTGWWATDNDSAGGNHGSGSVPGSYTVVTQTLMHGHAPVPNSALNMVAEDQWAVRRWTSDFGGAMTLSGFIAHADYGAVLGNGTEAHILVDGVSVYSYDVAPGDLIGTNFSLDLIIDQGSVIEMVLGAKGHPYFDATEFTVQMSRVVPAPGSLALIGLGGLAAAKRRRR